MPTRIGASVFFAWIATAAAMSTAVIGCRSPAALASARPPQTPEVCTVSTSTSATVHFQLFLPREYGNDPAKRWPLILFLHGSGERGDDISLVKIHGPPKIAEARVDFPFIVVSPQCPANESWDNDVLDGLLDHVMATWTVDERRVYLTGLSMGGFAAWSLAQQSPERFAAVVPICGGGTAIQAWQYGDSPKGKALQALPFWAFHGANDPVVDPSQSLRMVEALRGIGCDVRHTVYPDVGHDSWVKAYDDDALYAWLLSHSRAD